MFDRRGGARLIQARGSTVLVSTGRRLLGGILGAAAVVGGVASAGAAPSASAACRHRARGGEIVAQGPKALVYRSDIFDYYGCWYASGRHTSLGVDVPDVRAVRFVGRYVAFVVVDEDAAGPGHAEKLVVTDLLAGHQAAVGPPLVEGRDGSSYIVTKYVVRASGAAAYIASHGGVNADRSANVVPDFAVRTIRPHIRGFTELDRGEDIDGGSLQRVGSTITWTRGGATKRAPFPR
ncbi:MAG: hypothetical protein JWM31_3420 [Solirubrobacterales bacterium]|nr:hypothetical protein [Solirubrobacterales bacterium]